MLKKVDHASGQLVIPGKVGGPLQHPNQSFPVRKVDHKPAQLVIPAQARIHNYHCLRADFLESQPSFDIVPKCSGGDVTSFAAET